MFIIHCSIYLAEIFFSYILTFIQLILQYRRIDPFNISTVKILNRQKKWYNFTKISRIVDLTIREKSSWIIEHLSMDRCFIKQMFQITSSRSTTSTKRNTDPFVHSSKTATTFIFFAWLYLLSRYFRLVKYADGLSFRNRPLRQIHPTFRRKPPSG